MKNLELYGPFLWMEYNCLGGTESLQGEGLLLTTQSPGVTITPLIDLGRLKGQIDLGAIQ